MIKEENHSSRGEPPGLCLALKIWTGGLAIREPGQKNFLLLAMKGGKTQYQKKN